MMGHIDNIKFKYDSTHGAKCVMLAFVASWGSCFGPTKPLANPRDLQHLLGCHAPGDMSGLIFKGC